MNTSKCGVKGPHVDLLTDSKELAVFFAFPSVWKDEWAHRAGAVVVAEVLIADHDAPFDISVFP